MNANASAATLPTAQGRWVYLFAMLGSLIYATIYLRVSQATGRLGQDITYDDIGYVNDAVARVDAGLRDGIFAFFGTFVDTPPHSPFSTLLASGALLFGGYRDISFYAANSLILIAASLFIAYQFRAQKAAIVSWAVIAFLSSPLAFRAMHDFRPDLALGICTGAMVWLYMEGLRDDREKAYARAGVLFGVALLIKPTFFAHTTAIALALAGTQFIPKSLYRLAGWSTPGRRTRNSGVFIGIGLLIATPYFLLNGHQIVSYFFTHTRGETSAIWSFPSELSLASVAAAYLTVTYQATIGFHAVLSGVVLLAMLAIFAYRRDFRAILEAGFLLGFALLCFCIIVAGRHKNEYFLASAQFLVLLAAIAAICRLTLTTRVQAWSVATLLWIALGLAVFWNQRLPTWQVAQEARIGDSWNSRLATAIAADLAQHGVRASLERSTSVFVSVSGPVNAQTLIWTAAKLGWRWRALEADLTAAFPDDVAYTSMAQYVVVPNEPLAEYYRWLPSAGHQQELLDFLSGNPAFRRIEETSRTPRYFLFANDKNIRPAGPTIDADGIIAISGFLPEEGPYPQWNLPRVRWMSGPNGTVCTSSPTERNVTLRLRFRPEKDGALQLTTAEGVSSYEFEVGVFQELQMSFTQPAGASCVELDAQMLAPEDPLRYLLFTQIELKASQI